MARNSKLATGLAAVAKNILSAGSAQPRKVEMPKTIAEVHVSPTDVIPAGTLITAAIAELAGFDEEAFADLERKGAIAYVEVYAEIAEAAEQAVDA